MKLWKLAFVLTLCLSLFACGNTPAEKTAEPPVTAAADPGETPSAPADSTLSLDPDEEPSPAASWTARRTGLSFWRSWTKGSMGEPGSTGLP